jgi:hypothetical protein
LDGGSKLHQLPLFRFAIGMQKHHPRETVVLPVLNTGCDRRFSA